MAKIVELMGELFCSNCGEFVAHKSGGKLPEECPNCGEKLEYPKEVLLDREWD